ncbi:MAG: peptidoglycan DD-metalloendopeptidase family protein [Bacteroidota bacterium]
MRKYWAEIILFLAVLGVLSLYYLNNRIYDDFEEITEAPLPELRFGLPVDSFHVVEGKIKPNQNLGDLLTGFGVSMADVDKLARNSAEVFDVRRIRSGNNFYIFQSLDSARTARFLVYENNRIDYVIFSLTDSLNSFTGQREVEVVQKTAWGVINSSLWNALVQNGLSPILAVELSEIFAWTIDFFGIQKGDRFRVMYEEQFVDGVSVGVGPVHAVEFEHMNKVYSAYRFYQDDRFEYFDREGQSLRKAFLKSPLKYAARVSSHFSHGRMHPILKIRRPHHGVDYAAPAGTPVLTIGDGIVQERGYQAGGAGNFVRIKHNSVYTTVYMHLRGFGPGVNKGSRVTQGQVIGYVGSTGLSTGPHLDFRVYMNGSPIDPLRMEAPPSEPVKPDNFVGFAALRDSLSRDLQLIMWDGHLTSAEQGQVTAQDGL